MCRMLREKDRKSPPSYKFTCSCNMLLYQVIDDHVFFEQIIQVLAKRADCHQDWTSSKQKRSANDPCKPWQQYIQLQQIYTNITISKHPWYRKACLSPVPKGLVIPTKYESVRIAIPFPLPNMRQLNTIHQCQSFINNISPNTKHDHFNHSICSKNVISSAKPWFQGTVWY